MHGFKRRYLLNIILLLSLLPVAGGCDELNIPEPESPERAAISPSTSLEDLPEIIEFYADPDEVMANEDAVLHWNVSGASSVTIEPDLGDVAFSGNQSVRPSVDTVYILTAYNEYGSITARVQVIGYDGPLTTTVEASPKPTLTETPPKLTDEPSSLEQKVLLPIIHSFKADPESISIGNSSKLRWEVSNADIITITASGFAYKDDSIAGSTIASPTVTTRYTLQASNAKGSVSQICIITVVESEITKPTPSLETAGIPTIEYFRADPDSITAGSQIKLSWEVSNADIITITASGFAYKDDSLAGSTIASPTTTTKYTLQAYNTKGSASQSVTVTVVESKTPTRRPSLEQELVSKLKGDVATFQLIELDMDKLAAGLNREDTVSVPVTGAGGEGITLVSTLSERVFLRDPELSVAIGKMSKPDEKPSTVPMKLAPERNYRVMVNFPPKEKNESWLYGALTILDDDETMVSGMIMDSELGISFIEPVDIILGTRQNPGLHIVYNIKDTFMFTCSNEDEEYETSNVGQSNYLNKSSVTSLAIMPTPHFYTNIVLDGDQQFYNIDPSTVWSRMESVFNNVDFIYSINEPLSLDWGLHLTVKGLEVWISGGPTTTNKVALSNELEDPGYFLIHPVEKDEIHFFFVGYDVSGVYGRACGIGNSGSDWFGGSEGRNHAYAEAMATQSLKAQWVVMAHEIGHLIGGRHEDGVVTGECAGGVLSSTLCAPSLMPAGSAGAPEGRSPFFSNANDANILTTLYSVLPLP